MTDPIGDLAAPYARLPVDGVAISTLVAPFSSETVAASTPFAARLDEIQLDLGEGPIWQAVRERTPVIRSDLATTRSDEWPTALAALRDAGTGAVYAFPMVVGSLGVGSVGLYAVAGSTITAAELPGITDLTRRTARLVLARGLHRAADERPGEWMPGPYSRRDVHQAAGMVAAQTGTTPDDALLLIRAHAFSSGQSVLQVSARILDRELDLGEPSDTDAGGRNTP